MAKKFEFRLQSYLKLKEQNELDARREFAMKRSELQVIENQVTAIQSQRLEVLKQAAASLDDRLQLAMSLTILDDDERCQRCLIGVLQDELRKVLSVWTQARKELKAVEKLREKQLSEFELEASRQAQKDLDEWAVLNRTRLTGAAS